MKNYQIKLLSSLENKLVRDIHEAYVQVIMSHVPVITEKNVIMPNKQKVINEIYDLLTDSYRKMSTLMCLKSLISDYVSKKYEVLMRVPV